MGTKGTATNHGFSNKVSSEGRTTRCCAFYLEVARHIDLHVHISTAGMGKLKLESVSAKRKKNDEICS